MQREGASWMIRGRHTYLLTYVDVPTSSHDVTHMRISAQFAHDGKSCG